MDERINPDPDPFYFDSHSLDSGSYCHFQLHDAASNQEGHYDVAQG